MSEKFALTLPRAARVPPSPALRERGGVRDADIHARRWLVLALVGGALLPLVGCARKNRPEHPPGSDFPRRYPTE